VQKDAGIGIGASDAEYIEAGAEILKSATDIFERARLIIKVKEPQPIECKCLKKIILCLLIYIWLRTLLKLKP